MNNEERKYLLNECINQFIKAENFINIGKIYEAVETLGKAKMLKEIIEKYIDCQPKKYYEKYMKIVMLCNKW